MKHTVTATYRTSPESLFQVSVTLGSTFPDAIDEARAQAVRGVKEMLADVMTNYVDEAE